MLDRRRWLHCPTVRSGRGDSRRSIPRPTRWSKSAPWARSGPLKTLWRRAIERALEAGASDEDIVATLISVATIIGEARVASAAPAIARTIGYDVDGALQA